MQAGSRECSPAGGSAALEVRLEAESTMAWLAYLWMACVWTAVADQSLQSLIPRYPELGKSEALPCGSAEGSCQRAYWSRMQRNWPGNFQFLLSHIAADKSTYGPGVDEAKYKGSVQSGSRAYPLRVMDVREEDAGLYFCILQCKSATLHLGSPVTDLRPGEEALAPAPTPTTTTAAKRKKAPSSCPCRDKDKTQPVKGCGLLVFWSLVGTLLALALGLLATLLYFSRLPKKCHHHFVKK